MAVNPPTATYGGKGIDSLKAISRNRKALSWSLQTMTGLSERDIAAKEFIDWVVLRSYDAAIQDVRQLLEEGPIGTEPSAQNVRLHRWYQALSNADRREVQGIVRDTADAAVFHFLVLLDGLAGGWPISGQPSDFALYLQGYIDNGARRADAPTTRVKINSADALDSLHDLFRDFMNDREQSQETRKNSVE